MSQVVTIELDAASFGWLNELRRTHFPAALNHLDAHLTLFHKVEEDDIATIASVLDDRRPQPIALRFRGLRNLGRGVAVDIEAPALVELRAALARALAGRMTRQDQQLFRPHVTIQNKVDPIAARQLLHDLGAVFSAREGTGNAILIGDYLGGPWRLRDRLPFLTAH